MTENVADKVYFLSSGKGKNLSRPNILVPFALDSLIYPLGEWDEDQVKTEVRALTVGTLGYQRMPLKSIGTAGEWRKLNEILEYSGPLIGNIRNYFCVFLKSIIIVSCYDRMYMSVVDSRKLINVCDFCGIFFGLYIWNKTRGFLLTARS